MSVPLDRLYNFLEDVVKTDIIIYRWFPHGSKKLEHMVPLKNYTNQQLETSLVMLSHDQEPINFSQYSNQDIIQWKNYMVQIDPTSRHISDEQAVELFRKFELKILATGDSDKPVLFTHSELNSKQVSNLASKNHWPVYFWSHGLIARDWYRYAEHDPLLHKKNIQKLFLIYNRAWGGSREYRLKFAELVSKSSVATLCKMGFNPIDNEQHYRAHEFANPAFKIVATDLEQHFTLNQTPASASADYCSTDYQETHVEVVLETLFDDERLHLTEKALRPIACAQPFILASTPGALEYLRSYGFETFSGLIDETYDTIKDPVQRLRAIVYAMDQLTLANEHTLQQLRAIAKRNQKHFFSHAFQQQIINEFLTNFDQAILSITPSQSSPGGVCS